jgi:hypothetical protein
MKEQPMNEKEVRRRNKKVPPLMGSTEVSAALGVKPPNLRKVAGLPEPVPWSTELVRGDLWRADVIEEFAVEYRERRKASDPVKAPV